MRCKPLHVITLAVLLVYFFTDVAKRQEFASGSGAVFVVLCGLFVLVIKLDRELKQVRKQLENERAHSPTR